MHKILYLFFVISLLTGLAFAQESDKKEKKEQTQNQNQSEKKPNQKFVDVDGDGFNDNAPDHDGDGIPNGLDPDWQKEQEKFVDLDGDGINDNKLQEQSRERQRSFGPASSTQSSKGSPQVKSEEQKNQHKGQKGKK